MHRPKHRETVRNEFVLAMEITGIWLWRVYRYYSSLNMHVVNRAPAIGSRRISRRR